MILRESRFGTFLGCSGYPECKTTVPCDATGNPLPKVKPDEVNVPCPECGKPMAAKRFRGRSFLGCTGYPACKTTQPMPPGIAIDWPEKKVEATNIKCDKCGSPMILRFSRRGPFLGCGAYPKCKNIMKVPPELLPPKEDKDKQSEGSNTEEEKK
jgi:DNA topoisomerase-1